MGSNPTVATKFFKVKAMWKRGRQNTGYFILALFKSKRFECDCYLIRYPHDSEIPPHTDPVSEGKNHHRLNVILWPALSGGEFKCDNYQQFGPIIYFRPDLSCHSVTKVVGSRWVLSVGWLTTAIDDATSTMVQ